MDMIDGGESDYKIIAVPVEDKRWDDTQDLGDLNKHMLKEFTHFFETYKQLKGKPVEVKINSIMGKKEAIEAVKKSMELYAQNIVSNTVNRMKYENVTVEKKEKSQVEIKAEIPASVVSEYKPKAIKDISENVSIDGFRKGHIPEKVLVERVGELAILEESAELAIKDIVPEIIEKNVPDYIGQPKINIIKLAPENPVGISITIAVRPEIKLPDYKKISKSHMGKKEETEEVSEKEIENVIEEVRKQQAHVEFHKQNKEEGHSHSDEALDALKPEINDEFVKTVGDFKNVDEFKAKIKENLSKEKEHRALEKRRGELLEELVKETSADVPQVLVDNELNRMFAQFESDISGLGLKVEDYLKHINKTPEDLVKDWSVDAEKRAKLNVILEEIAKKEDIKADQDAVKIEVDNLMKQYKDIDPIRATAYTEHMLTVEKVIQFLESQNNLKVF